MYDDVQSQQDRTLQLVSKVSIYSYFLDRAWKAWTLVPREIAGRHVVGGKAAYLQFYQLS